MSDLSKYILEIRRDFSQMELNEGQVHSDPSRQFEQWFQQAVDANVNEPNACVLSTASREGRPSARVVLCREFKENKFGLFTNYNSRKGKELTENPFACLTFFWPELERQVRIEGRVEKHGKEASDRYFYSRPRNSRIAAWSSPQSEALKNRHQLEQLVTDYDKRYPHEDVPRPDFWGGYVLMASYYEFWQGRPSRLHDRLCYELIDGNKWELKRLAP